MAYDRFMIAPINGGLQTDLLPWQIMDDSFSKMENAYIYRGRVRKKPGTRYMNNQVPVGLQQLYSRLRITVTTVTSSAASGRVPGVKFNVGQQFSIGTQIYTVQATGTPVTMLCTSPSIIIGTTDNTGAASGTVPGSLGAIGQTFIIGSQLFTVTLISGALTTSGPGSGTFDTTTGAFTFTGADPLTTIDWYSNPVGTYNTSTGAFSFINVGLANATPVYWYPADPVTGFALYQTSTSTADPTYAFDTQFSYQFNPAGSGGWDILGALPTPIGTTDGAGNASGTFPALSPFAIIGQTFRIGTQVFVITATSGALTTTGSGTGTYNTGTGAYTFTGAAASTPIYYYGGLWTGTDNQLFWTVTWQGETPANRYLFVTNNKPADGIQYYNGSSWLTLAPVVDKDNDYLQTALMLVVFKNHLIAFSPTISAGGGTTYTNMAMWAAFGDPTAAGAWNNSLPGKGNNLVAPTMEQIQSCEFVKDRLVVYFERSTYEFAYTGNYANPFQWNLLNTELGTESTFSTVPFDKQCLTVGNVGIHACNAQNVQRIDNKIPYSVWDIRSGSNQVERVYGIRDYYAEQVYWTFPNTDADKNSQTYPNKILAYNYITGSWAEFDDSITAFGYFYESSFSAITWNSTSITWDNSEVTWDGGTGQALNQVIIAGNQEGFTFIVDVDYNNQDPVLQITNLTLVSGNTTVTCINHNFNVGDFVYLNNLYGLSGPFKSFYEIIDIPTANTLIIMAPDVYASLMTDTYLGGGTLARVPAIDIYTKQFNFYIKDDRNASIARVDFLVNRTGAGQISVDYLTSTSPNGTVANAQATGALLGNSILTTYPYDATLYPYEKYQDRLWHPIFPVAEGNAVQIRLYFSNDQLADGNNFFADFQLHALCFYTTKTSSRAQ